MVVGGWVDLVLAWPALACLSLHFSSASVVEGAVHGGLRSELLHVGLGGGERPLELGLGGVGGKEGNALLRALGHQGGRGKGEELLARELVRLLANLLVGRHLLPFVPLEPVPGNVGVDRGRALLVHGAKPDLHLRNGARGELVLGLWRGHFEQRVRQRALRVAQGLLQALNLHEARPQRLLRLTHVLNVLGGRLGAGLAHDHFLQVGVVLPRDVDQRKDAALDAVVLDQVAPPHALEADLHPS
mmetsp:Transcript_14284/g.36005  ORF Transcript_14284/g.36005 Transcript_14284/m.36005 type:complete len:244 (-) Transcript_14284:785-1516(-)